MIEEQIRMKIFSANRESVFLIDKIEKAFLCITTMIGNYHKIRIGC